MEAPGASEPSSSRGRGRGRGKSRGGLGKYLRARGRGGRGRPAEFRTRLLLEDEQQVEMDEEEAKEYEKELQRKFGRRQLGTNADRYAEPEPELDSEGEPIVEPEVDLSAFLEKQRISDPQPSSAPPPADDDDDIDTSIAPALGRGPVPNIMKGKIQQVEWDSSLEELSREKAAADATRELKSRFKTQSAKPSFRAPVRPVKEKGEKHYVEAPALPTDEPAKPKSEKEGMEDFLDDLLE